MVDMGQADRSLYAGPRRAQYKLCWLRAVSLAAQQLGFANIMDVPDHQVDAMKAIAKRLQIESDEAVAA